MERPMLRYTWRGPVARAPQAGTTLVEVLVAIFITAVGLLAMLTLFPLGALDMAQAIQDDRTAAVADEAVALSEAGKELISRTVCFVEASLSAGSVDPAIASRLREDYERLALQAEAVEARLLELQFAFPRHLIEPHVAPLLAQIRAIRRRIDPMTQLLSLLEGREPDR